MAERKPLVLLDNNLISELPAGDTLPGLEEAPQDGNTYGRKDADWVQITGGGGGGVLYKKQVRFIASGTWTMPSTAISTAEILCVGGGSSGGQLVSGTYSNNAGGTTYIYASDGTTVVQQASGGAATAPGFGGGNGAKALLTLASSPFVPVVMTATAGYKTYAGGGGCGGYPVGVFGHVPPAGSGVASTDATGRGDGGGGMTAAAVSNSVASVGGNGGQVTERIRNLVPGATYVISIGAGGARPNAGDVTRGGKGGDGLVEIVYWDTVP